MWIQQTCVCLAFNYGAGACCIWKMCFVSFVLNLGSVLLSEYVKNRKQPMTEECKTEPPTIMPQKCCVWNSVAAQMNSENRKYPYRCFLYLKMKQHLWYLTEFHKRWKQAACCASSLGKHFIRTKLWKVFFFSEFIVGKKSLNQPNKQRTKPLQWEEGGVLPVQVQVAAIYINTIKDTIKHPSGKTTAACTVCRRYMLLRGLQHGS